MKRMTKMNDSMKKNSSMTLPALVPLIAGLFFIVERVLVSGTTAPAYSDSPKRYLLFTAMKFLTTAGVSLLPLWLGYYGKRYNAKQALSKLAEFWLFYVFAMVGTFVFFFILRDTLTIRDLWVILFPISQNYFTFSVSFVAAFLVTPLLVQGLERLSSKQILRLLAVLTVVFVLSPTIFSKDIWSFNSGKSLLWQLFLVVVGYSCKRFGILEKIRWPFVQTMMAVIFAVLSVIIMAQVSLLLRGNTDTAERFMVPYSLFGMYYSFTMFVMIEKIQRKIKLVLSSRLLAILLIVIQVVCNNGLVSWSVSEYYRRPLTSSVYQWITGIGIFLLIYLAGVLALSVLIAIAARLRIFKKIAAKLTFSSVDQLFSKLVKLKGWVIKNKRLWLTIGFFYGLVVLQMYFITKVTSSIPETVFKQNLLLRQPQLWLNVIIMLLFLVLIFLITNRFWYAAAFTTVVYIVLTISSYLKLTLRQEPVLPGDLRLLGGINEIVTMVQPTLLILGAIVMVILAIGAWLLQRRTRNKYGLALGLKERIIGITIILVMFSGVFFINHKNSPSNILFRLFKVDNQFYNQPRGAQRNGALVQFLVNIDVEVMAKPSGYSETEIERIMAKYDEAAVQINKDRSEWAQNQTIIFNLSESFSDPARIPETTITKDPIPNLKKYKEETTSGLMLSSGYGGGTANIEWETLSGLSMSNLAPTLPTPYAQLVNGQKIAPNFTNLFDQKIVVHPYVATLYNRVQVFEKYGFDAFYHVDSKYKLQYTEKIKGSPYISDASAYKEVLRLLNESSKGSQFIQLSSMQNHGPYTYTYPDNEFDFTGPSVESSNHKAFQTYMQGLNYTDDALKSFIDALDKIDKPITFIFYGDHLPSLFSGLSMSEYGLALHETDYFIYNNAYSRKQQKFNADIVSPNAFSALALKQAGLQVTPYYALLTELMEKVPAMTMNPETSVQNEVNGSQIFVTETGEKLEAAELTEEQQQLLEDYRMIQYDLTVGKQYSAKWASQSRK